MNFEPYHFEVVLIPGHTPGSIALWEKEKRFLISGDSVTNATTFLFGRGPESAGVFMQPAEIGGDRGPARCDLWFTWTGGGPANEDQ